MTQQTILGEPITLHAVDLTLGQRWMEKEIRKYGIYADYLGCDLDKTKRPRIQIDFRQTPFRDETFDLVLFDPPWLTDSRAAGLVEKYVWRGQANFSVWKSRDQMKKGVYNGLKETGRIVKPGGRVVLKWGSGSGIDIRRVLMLKPRCLTVERILVRPSKGGANETTWHVLFRRQPVKTGSRIHTDPGGTPPSPTALTFDV